MIKAMIFDLDGTLVQTERLKAISYARATTELCPHDLKEDDVIEAFKDVVGLSRREVAMALVKRFDLAEKAGKRMAEFGVSTPWQAYVQVRLKIYAEILSDPQVIRDNQWAHNIALLEEARKANCKVGLATMSYCEQASRVLKILELENAFGFVATRDDVKHGKPNPEMYLLVAKELDVNPSDCLVIEDSPAGVEAALNAKMQVVAVSTPFTQKRLHESKLIPESHIVDNPEKLPDVVAHLVEHLNKEI
ncbi:MAG: HAD family phosphatase [Anaerolineae bacterium]|jgi:HAD superfamily hydrolase (TIGR01509 family)|nr:HAD family phosphatase [Anaerolineae bacterium]MBT3714812.1 HAD family phosphatase [Anaerolineae bacterium]MBT4310965.1 HAD family phosphatase [Anaerolineae bacterium]MBT4458435.1 HAD family phosphatase [Anaerolineae bacterium]MBT4843787.1 HAD family phosphatase [Anaerolineae bacterium]